MAKFGIPDEAWLKIIALFDKQSDIQEVLIFGSRAKGSQRNGSDIDLAIKGQGLSIDQVNKIQLDYEQLFLPWKLDILVWDSIQNQALREHIERVGQQVYCK